MKREILCPMCANKTRALFPTDNPYPDEFVKFVGGMALFDMYCDGCMKTLVSGDHCVAVSFWHKLRNPYYEWELDYIDLTVFDHDEEREYGMHDYMMKNKRGDL